MSEDKTLTKIPHFDGHYDHWSELMENLLRAKGLWSLVEEGFTEPAAGIETTAAQQKSLEELKMKDHQVKHYLFQATDRVVFEQILDRKTSKIVWDSLKGKFGGNERVKRSLLQTLRRDFEVLIMKNDESIDDYFRRVMTVSDQMRSNGEDMPDSKIVEKILQTLTDKFMYVVVSIEESKDTRSMTIDELQSSLSVHEKKFKKKKFKHSMWEEEAEDPTEVVEGAGGFLSIRQRLNASTVTNLDIFNTNVQTGTMEHTLQSLKKRMKFFSWHMSNFMEPEEKMFGLWILDAQTTCVERETCSQAWILLLHITSSSETITS